MTLVAGDVHDVVAVLVVDHHAVADALLLSWA